MMTFTLGTPRPHDVIREYSFEHERGSRSKVESAARTAVLWQGETVAEVHTPAARAAFPALAESVREGGPVDVDPARIVSWPAGSVRRAHLDLVIRALEAGAPGSVASPGGSHAEEAAAAGAPVASLSDVPALANLCGFLGADWAVAPIFEALRAGGTAAQPAASVARAILADVATRGLRRAPGPLADIWAAAARGVRAAGGIESADVRVMVFGLAAPTASVGLDVASFLELHGDYDVVPARDLGDDGEPAATARGAEHLINLRDVVAAASSRPTVDPAGTDWLDPAGTDWLDPAESGTLDLLGDAFANECRWAADDWAAAPGSIAAAASGDVPRRSVAELGRALKAGAPFSGALDAIKTRAALALGDPRAAADWPWAPAWHAEVYRTILCVEMLS